MRISRVRDSILTDIYQRYTDDISHSIHLKIVICVTTYLALLFQFICLYEKEWFFSVDWTDVHATMFKELTSAQF